MSHANAAPTPRARLRLARLVVADGWPVAAEVPPVVTLTASEYATGSGTVVTLHAFATEEEMSTLLPIVDALDSSVIAPFGPSTPCSTWVSEDRGSRSLSQVVVSSRRFRPTCARCRTRSRSAEPSRRAAATRPRQTQGGRRRRDPLPTEESR